MPWISEYMEPEVLLEYLGVIVYHTYRNDEYNDRSEFWYTTDPAHTDWKSSLPTNTAFDIRSLPGVDISVPADKELHKLILTKAIDDGHLTNQGV